MRKLLIALSLAAAPANALAQAPPAGPQPALQSTPMTQPPPNPAGVRDAAQMLAAAPKKTISNGVLTAVLLTPGSPQSFYQGVRFDRAGVVSSLKYGSTEYYGLWFDGVSADVRDYQFVDDKVIAGPNTAALGPADAYDANNPPGWADAAPGASFLKIGVGMLKKPEGQPNYNSFLTYDIANGGAWKVSAKKDSVTFTHTLTDKATGYGYVYTKTIRLLPKQPVMVIAKPIESNSFNHNFMTLGQGPTAPGFEVASAAPLNPARALGDVATFEGGKLRWNRAMADQDRFLTPLGDYTSAGGGAYDVTLRNAQGAGVHIEGDIKMASFTVWGIRRVLAAEPFVNLKAAPGQTLKWSYRYTYSAPAATP
jgi:hypothetical protein